MQLGNVWEKKIEEVSVPKKELFKNFIKTNESSHKSEKEVQKIIKELRM